MLATFLKLLLLAALSPIWLPIVRELYREVEAALLEEGGLLGRPPTPSELAELKVKYKDYRDPLISEPWAEARAERARPKGPARPVREDSRAAPGGSAGGGFRRS